MSGSALPGLMQAALPAADFIAWLRREGERRYHARHPFHRRMHAGLLTRAELVIWAANRYYYQSRIPIKDALIVSKAEDPEFRRGWLRRITDHDGQRPGDGGLEHWLRLGEALGLSRPSLLAFEHVAPGVRFACDAYVTLVRERSLLEGVAASLTECFAPKLMLERLAAFQQHYGFVDPAALQYFDVRVPRARRDAEEALAFVVKHATTFPEQAACVDALVRKTEILWHLLDCVSAACDSSNASHAAA